MRSPPVSERDRREKGDRAVNIEYVLPNEIEKRSFEIIEQELSALNKPLDPVTKPIVLRVIHATADFDFYDNLRFSENAVDIALGLLKSGAAIVTDTNMARSGISKAALAKLGGEIHCFMADPDIAQAAAEHGTTRAAAAADKTAALEKPVIFACGNAPTALIRLAELIRAGEFRPALVIAAPVGFVNVVPAKELIMESGVPYIAAVGRKGGSTVAAAIVNALLYMCTRDR